MLDVRALKAEDLQGLDPSAIAAVAAKMLAHIGEQDRHIDAQAREIERKDAELHFKSAKLEKITFELARSKPGSSVPAPRR
jgi:ribosomal silencing factor RsfS